MTVPALHRVRLLATVYAAIDAVRPVGSTFMVRPPTVVSVPFPSRSPSRREHSRARSSRRSERPSLPSSTHCRSARRCPDPDRPACLWRSPGCDERDQPGRQRRQLGCGRFAFNGHQDVQRRGELNDRRQTDFVQRLKAVLPSRWFPDSSPVLDGVLTGLASAWTWLYGLLDSFASRAVWPLRPASGSTWSPPISLASASVAARRSSMTTFALDPARTGEGAGNKSRCIAALNDLTGRSPQFSNPLAPAIRAVMAERAAAAAGSATALQEAGDRWACRSNSL